MSRGPARASGRILIALGGATTAVVLLGLLGAAATAAGRADVPVQPDRGQARAWAVQELSGREYRNPGNNWISRALRWVFQFVMNHLPNGPGSGIGLGIVLAAVLAVIAVAVRQAGGLRRQRRARTPDEVFQGSPMTAADHRRAAERAAASGDWATCVLERFRAIVRELEQRALITVRPGRTADEAARDAGAWLPDLADELMAAARAFDDVRYGDRPATPQAAEGLRLLDERVWAARPRQEAVVQAGPAVPT